MGVSWAGEGIGRRGAVVLLWGAEALLVWTGEVDFGGIVVKAWVEIFLAVKVRVPDPETVSFEPVLAGTVTELSSACETLGAAVVCCFAIAAVGKERSVAASPFVVTLAM